ncbi:MAG: hypothetical protein JWP87_2051 [Labilithrix sp.]|nr:hypothetical protein [Labilithrix sp.]
MVGAARARGRARLTEGPPRELVVVDQIAQPAVDLRVARRRHWLPQERGERIVLFAYERERIVARRRDRSAGEHDRAHHDRGDHVSNSPAPCAAATVSSRRPRRSRMHNMTTADPSGGARVPPLRDGQLSCMRARTTDVALPLVTERNGLQAPTGQTKSNFSPSFSTPLSTLLPSFGASHMTW